MLFAEFLEPSLMIYWTHESEMYNIDTVISDYNDISLDYSVTIESSLTNMADMKPLPAQYSFMVNAFYNFTLANSICNNVSTKHHSFRLCEICYTIL